VYDNSMQWIPTAILPMIGLALTVSAFVFIVLQQTKQRRPITSPLLLLCSSLTVWLIGSLAMLLYRNDGELALTWDRIAYVGVVWLPAIMYHFTGVYTQQKENARKTRWFYAVSLLFLLTIPTEYFVSGLYQYSWGVHSAAQIVHHAFMGYLVVASWILYRMALRFLKNQRHDPKRRQEIILILSAYSLFLITGVSAFLAAYHIDIYPVPHAITPLFLWLLSFGVMAQSALDVRKAAKWFIQISGAVIYVSVLYLGANALINRYLGLQFVKDYYFVMTFILLIIIAFSFGTFQSLLERAIDDRLFRQERRREQALRQLGEDLNKALDLRSALDQLAKTASQGLNMSNNRTLSVIFTQANELMEQEGTEIKEIYATGYPAVNSGLIKREDGMVTFFTERQESIFITDLTHEVEAEEQQIAAGNLPKTAADRARFIRFHSLKSLVNQRFAALQATVAIPLFLKQQLIGLVIVGADQSELPPFKEVSDWLSELATTGVAGIQKANLYQVDQMKTEFVSIASHELRTPLTAIRGYLSMILEEGLAGKELDAERREYLNRVYVIARQLAMLVNDLLTISRIESGKMHFDPKSLEVGGFIPGLRPTFKRVAEQRNVTVRIPEQSETTGLPAVLADEAGMKELFTNLMTNAITYNKPGGTVTVSYKVWEKEKQLEVTISDTGIGMSKEQMSHLFERFYRVDSPETSGIVGTGLGLYLCKLITERMGGSINVESVLKRGTTFRVYLPLAK
jgi:signal transduction histidine kinase